MAELQESSRYRSIRIGFLYGTTVALIISNVVTIIFAITFAVALEVNVGNVAKLQRSSALSPVQIARCQENRDYCLTTCDRLPEEGSRRPCYDNCYSVFSCSGGL